MFKKKKIDMEGVRNILRGKADEIMLEKIFEEMDVDFKPQVKKEIRITDEIVLVVKPDFIFPEFILETKHPVRFLMEGEIPTRYQYQLESYYRGFYLPIYLGEFQNPFGVRLIPYIPNKGRWEKIKKVLKDFYRELKRSKN